MTATGQWLDEVRYMHHPLTGERLTPLGFTSRGPVWPVLGASEAAPEQPAGDDEDEDQDAQSPGSDDGAESAEEDTKPEAGKSYTQADIDAIKARMQAADRRATAAELKAKSFEDKDKTELQRATDRSSELEQELTTLKESVKALRLGNAFLSANTYTWHDPDLALAQVDKDLLELDDDGTPSKESLKKALKALADKRPYLVKSATPAASGDPGPAKSRNAEKDSKSRRSELEKRGLTGSFRR